MKGVEERLERVERNLSLLMRLVANSSTDGVGLELERRAQELEEAGDEA